jgi:hypothetical protein
MNQFALRMFVRSILAEAKDKKADDKTKDKKAVAPKKTTKKEPKKSSGNLVEMKKDLAALKEKSSKIDDLIKEWEQVKSAAGSISYGGEQAIEIGADAKEAIVEDCDKEIEKLKKEKESIDKEIADLKENTTNEINKIKEMMGLASKKKEKGQEKMMDEKKEELDEARFKKGTDIGKPGKGFEKIAKSAAKRYGSEEAGKKVAGAILKKVVKK